MGNRKDPKQQDIRGENQGEGDKRSARRFNERERDFVEHTDTDAKARQGQPKTRQEAEDLKRAEADAAKRAKEHDPNEVRREGPV